MSGDRGGLPPDVAERLARAGFRWSLEALGGLSLVETLGPAGLEGRLERFRRERPLAHPRGAASIWSKALLRVLLPPLLAAAATGRLGLSEVGETGSALRVALRDGMPERLLLPPAAFGPGGIGLDAALPLLLQPVERLAEGCRAASGLVPRVVWSNAGNLAEAVVGGLAALPGRAEAAERLRQALLEPARLPDGRRNPLHVPVRYLAPLAPGGRPRRLRRICCLRYLAGEPLCASCPRPGSPAFGQPEGE